MLQSKKLTRSTSYSVVWFFCLYELSCMGKQAHMNSDLLILAQYWQRMCKEYLIVMKFKMTVLLLIKY